MIEYINVITYPHSDDLNEKISLAVNGRIIWGGDKTVDQFKKYATKPKVKDLYFTDKVSLCIINIEDEDKFNQDFDHLIRNLYNDIYPFHQKGCSSPHSLFIISRTANKQQTLQKIYDRLSEMAYKKYPEDISSIASLKLNQSVVDILEDKVVETIHNSNYLTFTGIKSDEVPHSCGAGYLYYKFANHLSDIKSSINPKTQTITYWGLSKDQMHSFLDTLDVEIDVEGFEEDVLAGAKNTLRADSLIAVIIGGQNETINKLSRDHGFIDYDYSPPERTLTLKKK